MAGRASTGHQYIRFPAKQRECERKDAADRVVASVMLDTWTQRAGDSTGSERNWPEMEIRKQLSASSNIDVNGRL